jgi:hypothetical protein
MMGYATTLDGSDNAFGRVGQSNKNLVAAGQSNTTICDQSHRSPSLFVGSVNKQSKQRRGLSALKASDRTCCICGQVECEGLVATEMDSLRIGVHTTNVGGA